MFIIRDSRYSRTAGRSFMTITFFVLGTACHDLWTGAEEKILGQTKFHLSNLIAESIRQIRCHYGYR